MVCRSLGMSNQTFYRLRNEYSGLKAQQVRRLKALEKEHLRLCRAAFRSDAWCHDPIGRRRSRMN